MNSTTTRTPNTEQFIEHAPERSMMEERASSTKSVIWGGLLVAAGLFFLIGNLGVFHLFDAIPQLIWAFLWMVAFALGGLAFLALMILRPANWWAAIPGFALLGLSGTIVASEFLTFIPFEGSIFLSSLGLGFFTVYLLNRSAWWALIPGGVLESLAVVAAVDELWSGDISGGVFFWGLGMTFVIVALAPTPQGRMTWAWYPAGVLLVFGVAIGLGLEALLTIGWPLLLLLGGLALVGRGLLRRNRL